MSAIVLCVLWVLWPLCALVGSGFAALVGFAALLAAPSAIRAFRPRIYLLLLAVFFGYAAWSSAWSPRALEFVQVDLTKGSINVRNEVLRLAPLLLAAGLLIGATLRLDGRRRRLVSSVALWALFVQVGMVATLTLFELPILDALRPIVPDTGEGVQNITRNSLLMATAAPALIAVVAGDRPLPAASLSMFGVAVIEAAVLFYRGVDAGLLALGVATLCIAIVLILPRHGFRLLGLLFAVAIMSAPWVFGYLSYGATAEAATTSAQWRLAIWAEAVKVIEAHPVYGAGLGALRTMRDPITEGVFTGQLHMPNHPHNMALQLWAETGAVGAALLSAAIVAAAFRLPSPRDIGRSAIHVAGLAGGAAVIAFVSFDLWNQDWWAAAGILAFLAAAAPRAVRKEAEERLGPGIVFGQPSAIPPPTAGAPAEAVSPPMAELPPVAAAERPRRALASAHDNNFNLLRLIFALMVTVYHLVRLSGAWPHALPALSVCAEIGVQGFFIVSGYLVYASLERSRLGGYAEKRLRRVYPAYVVVIIACTIGALALSPAARGDLAAVAKYFGANIVFLNFLAPDLPGVFAGNPVTEVNGALWTLRIEIAFYIILPALAWILRVSGSLRWWLIGAIYVGAEAWRYYFAQQKGFLFELHAQLPGQMSFFILGVALYVVRDSLNWRSLLLPAGAVALVASFLAPQLEPLRAAGLGVVVVWAAVVLPRLIDAAEFGDLSYGAYIIHFPIIQCVVALGLFAKPEQGAAIVVVAVLLLALAMWWLVERPALRRDSAYRQTAPATTEPQASPAPA